MSLRELYQELIVDHGKTPRNTGVLSNATHTKVGHNPLCGDQLTLYLNISQHHIEQIKFEGKGCAISMASASLLTEAVQGKTTAEVEKLFATFVTLATTGHTDEAMGKLEAFSGIAAFPARVKCATLAWHTLKAALLNNPEPVCTEKA